MTLIEWVGFFVSFVGFFVLLFRSVWEKRRAGQDAIEDSMDEVEQRKKLRAFLGALDEDMEEHQELERVLLPIAQPVLKIVPPPMPHYVEKSIVSAHFESPQEDAYTKKRGVVRSSSAAFVRKIPKKQLFLAHEIWDTRRY